MENLEVDFVLVRGPEKANRRLHVSIPADGTSVTIGRAFHCTAVVDPWLVFASQVQCTLFCVNPIPTQDRSEETEKNSVTSAENVEADMETPVRRATLPNLYIIDMCSSNGTFINNVRVGCVEPTLLKDGDSCIFGGMRDIDVGQAIPADAFAGPELCIWRVDILNGKHGPTAFNYEATPVLLPTTDALAEERSLLDTALRTLLKRCQESAATPLYDREPSVNKDSTPSPAAVAQQLYATPATQLPQRPKKRHMSSEIRAASNAAEEDKRDHSEAREKSTRLYEGGEDDRNGVEEEQHLCEGSGPLFSHAAEGLSPEGGGEGARRSSTVPTRFAAAKETSDRGCSMSLLGSDSEGAHGFTIETAPTRSYPTLIPQPSLPRSTLAYLQAVRLGCHTFHVPVECFHSVCPDMRQVIATQQPSDTAIPIKDGTQSEEPRGKRRKKRERGCCGEGPQHRGENEPGNKNPSSQPQCGFIKGQPCDTRVMPFPSYTMEFTDSHWKWVMDNPNGHSGSNPPAVFRCMLPVTSIGTVFLCKERLGLAVELKEGCQVPLVDPRVLSGCAENRWIVWMMQCIVAAADADSNKASASADTGRRGRQTDNTKKNRQKGLRAPRAFSWVPVPVAADSDGGEVELCFEAWLEHMEMLFRLYKMPAPLMVDAITFDQIFAPQMLKS